MEHDASKPKTIVLPLLVVGPVEVGRLLRELLEIDNVISQAKLAGRSEQLKMPKTSQLMDEAAQINQLDLLQSADRKLLFETLKSIALKAPVLHMSFSADPPPAFTAKLMTWIRREIHPQALLTIGLQPSIGAGCILRTTNKYFDLSLRKDFLGKRDLLRKRIVAEETA